MLANVMRIVQLANFYSPISGGLRTVVDTLGRGYAALGHERVLVVPGERAARRRTDTGLVITIPGVPVGGGYRVMPRSSAVLRLLDSLAVRRMSVEVSDKTTLVAAGQWARERGVGTVLFSHERLDRWIAARLPRLWTAGGKVLAPAVRSWNKGIVSRFDTVVVTSGYAEREFAGLEVALRRVPLGVDLSTFRPGPASVSASAGPARLVYAGRLSPEKNPAAVVGAVRELVAAGTPVRLDVYGDGPERVALTKQARDLPVEFHGHVADRLTLAGALSRADVAFAPSVAETFGLSILEAMACGTPVVTSTTGGAPELLSPFAGLAVEATPTGLAAGVAEILSWPVPARRAAARARAEQFPWSATISAMLDLHLGRSF